jgi:hypothetical protein
MLSEMWVEFQRKTGRSIYKGKEVENISIVFTRVTSPLHIRGEGLDETGMTNSMEDIMTGHTYI